MRLFKINLFLISIFTLFCINTNFICDNNSTLELSIRNNINGDFKKVEKLSDLAPGSFININWKDKTFMLPLSLRKGSISFSDLRWDWSYEYDDDGRVNEDEPALYEIISRGNNIKHECKNSSLAKS